MEWMPVLTFRCNNSRGDISQVKRSLRESTSQITGQTPVFSTISKPREERRISLAPSLAICARPLRKMLFELPSLCILFKQDIEFLIGETTSLRYAQICPYPTDGCKSSKEEAELSPEVCYILGQLSSSLDRKQSLTLVRIYHVGYRDCHGDSCQDVSASRTSTRVDSLTYRGLSSCCHRNRLRSDPCCRYLTKYNETDGSQ